MAKNYSSVTKAVVCFYKKELDSIAHSIFLFHYLQSHANTDVPRATVRSLEACRSISNLTETVRALGFDKHMKAIFFPGTSASRIHFTPKVELTPEQHKLFNKHLDLLRNKS